MTSRAFGARRVTRGLAVMLAAGAALAVGTARAPAAGAAANPIAAHSMLQLASPPSFMQAMFAEAAAMHAAYLRMDVAPALVFPAPGQPPDFSGLDEVVALSQQYHVPVVGDLLSIPWWIAACPDQASASDMPHCATNDVADYASMIGQIAARADPVIRDWEIWNEPDSSAFFHGTPQQYALMLRAAHDAIDAVDPQEQVLLGGLSGTGAIPWLGQVLATPGADAVHAFDIANIHERAPLDALAADVEQWRSALRAAGFTGPLWVTEHGYPSDPAFQYDPAYPSGTASQASYLAASVPTLIDAGAAEVFVTERDNLSGQFASEGLLGGDVADPGVPNPQVVERPAYGAMQTLAGCYLRLGRDCAGPPASAAPAALALGPRALGQSATATIAVSDPGPAPLQLGAAALAGAPDGLSITADACSGRILEPNRPCSLTVEYRAALGGAVAGLLQIPSDNGPLTAPVSGVSPAVSSLVPGAPGLAFIPTSGADGVGYPQRLALTLTNPLSADVHVTGLTVTGPDARRFAVQSNTCSPATLAPAGRCRISFRFTPARSGTAHAVLSLRGDGAPLAIPLTASAAALPGITRVSWPAGSACITAGRTAALTVLSDQPGSVRWNLAHELAPTPTGCGHAPAAPLGRTAAVGSRRSGRRRVRVGVRQGYETRLRVAGPRGRGLQAGVYRLTLTPLSGAGAGRARPAVVVVVVP